MNLDGQNINSVDTSESGVFYTITNAGEGLKYPEINDLKYKYCWLLH